MNSKGNLICLFLFIILSVSNCDENKIINEQSLDIDGTWLEYYWNGTMLDPDDFVIINDFEDPDGGGVYSPPEPNTLDSIYYRNDSCFGSFADGQILYFTNEPLKSILQFDSDSFNLQIIDGQLKEKELAGNFRIKGETIIFDINYNYYRYWETFDPGYDRNAEWSDSLLFEFKSADRLKIHTPVKYDDSGRIVISFTSFLWYLPPIPMQLKNSGLFDRMD